MNNWKVIFATVVIFGAGVITGGLLVNYAQVSFQNAVHHKAAGNAEVRPGGRAAGNGKVRTPEVLNKQFLQDLNESLHLSEAQREQIRKIISEGQSQIRKTIVDARLEIRETLTTEQKERFDELIKRPARKAAHNTNSPAISPPGGTNAAPGISKREL